MRAIFWHVKVVADWIVKFLNEFHWTTASEPGWCKIYPRGLCDVMRGSLWLVSTGQFSQREITRSIPRFALSNHLFPYRESGTPSFITYSAKLFYPYKLHTILGRTKSFLKKRNCLYRRKWGSTFLNFDLTYQLERMRLHCSCVLVTKVMKRPCMDEHWIYISGYKLKA